MVNKFDIPNVKSTADFVKIISQWWTIINVKSPNKCIKLSNELLKPLSVDDNNFKFLEEFLKWLGFWDSSMRTGGKLSRLTKPIN